MYDQKKLRRERRKQPIQFERTRRKPNATCGKVEYPTIDEALVVAATRLKKNSADQTYLRPYFHNVCGAYHLTHKPKF